MKLCRATLKKSAGINVPAAKTPSLAKNFVIAFIVKASHWIVCLAYYNKAKDVRRSDAK
jgi:hypothetical protein